MIKRRWMARSVAALGAMVVCVSLTGCLVMGYSSGGGMWIWPGSLVLTALLVLWFLLSRR